MRFVADSESAVCCNDQDVTSSTKHAGAGCTNSALVGGTDGDDGLERGRRSADCNAQEMGRMIEHDLYEIAWELSWMID